MKAHEELLILAAAKTAIMTRIDDLRMVVAGELEAGDQKRPTLAGVKLGTVSMSVGEDKVRVTDPAAFRAHMLATDMADEFPIIEPDDTAEILAVLAEHAPHLIKTEIVVDKEDETEAQKRALAGDEIPGLEVTQSASTLRVLPSKDAKAHAADALSRGALAIEVSAP